MVFDLQQVLGNYPPSNYSPTLPLTRPSSRRAQMKFIALPNATMKTAHLRPLRLL